MGVAGPHAPAVAQLSDGQDRCPSPARRRGCRPQHHEDPGGTDRVRADDRAAGAQTTADRGAHRSAEQRAETRDGEHQAQLQRGEAQLQVAVGDDEHEKDRLAREPHVRRESLAAEAGPAVAQRAPSLTSRARPRDPTCAGGEAAGSTTPFSEATIAAENTYVRASTSTASGAPRTRISAPAVPRETVPAWPSVLSHAWTR